MLALASILFLGILPISSRSAAAVLECEGDCGGDDRVTVDELLEGVNIALGHLPVGDCPLFDADEDGRVSVDELIRAVNNALGGCFDVAIALPGLRGRVGVSTDALGVPHVVASTLEDAVRAQGYLHARDRFFQMDVTRRRTEGTLAELTGEVTTNGLGSDLRFRDLGLRGAAERSAALLTGEERALLEA